MKKQHDDANVCKAAISARKFCRLSVTFVHPTQAIKIFGNIFISYERSFILVF